MDACVLCAGGLFVCLRACTRLVGWPPGSGGDGLYWERCGAQVKKPSLSVGALGTTTFTKVGAILMDWSLLSGDSGSLLSSLLYGVLKLSLSAPVGLGSVLGRTQQEGASHQFQPSSACGEACTVSEL